MKKFRTEISLASLNENADYKKRTNKIQKEKIYIELKFNEFSISHKIMFCDSSSSAFKLMVCWAAFARP